MFPYRGDAQRLHLLMHLYPWFHMVLLSELAAFGPVLTNAQKLPGAAEGKFQKMAEQHGICLLTGSMPERSDGLTYNIASVIDPRETKS